MFALIKKAIIFLLLIISTITVHSNSHKLYINEMMSSNDKFILDVDGDDSDWLEIYNDSRSAVNLSGYCLSDKRGNLELWRFPDTTIGPWGYLLVFASNKDRAVPGQELHTNFAISAGGEDLFLSFSGEIVHTLPAIELKSNLSYGLFPDGSEELFIFTSPSPGEANFYTSNDAVIDFSHPGGIYDEPFELSLFVRNVNHRIFYTTDGSIPTQDSRLYVGPLFLDSSQFPQLELSQILMSPPKLYNPPPLENVQKAIIIRAAIFSLGGDRLSQYYTNTYFIRNLSGLSSSLPVVSIVGDNYDLFDKDWGILVPGIYYVEGYEFQSGNYWQRGEYWEKEVSVEYYLPNGETALKQNAGLRTHGGTSRFLPQKGLRIHARSKYGMSRFHHKLFEDRQTNSFKSLIFKPLWASWLHTGVEDFISTRYVASLNLDRAVSRPVVLYLNGEYWGLYFVSERMDEHYLETYHGVPTDGVDIIGNWYGLVESGDSAEFFKMYKFIEKNDLSVYENYNYVESLIDLDNFIDYQIFQIFSANLDWPANNMRCWRERKPGSKWRWVFFDGDACYSDPEYDMFAHALDTSDNFWPTNATSTLFFRKFMQNDIFRNKFFKRFEKLLNETLFYLNTSPTLKYAERIIQTEIYRQIGRFGIPYCYATWEGNIAKVDRFLNERACWLNKHLLEHFGIELKLIDCQPNSVVEKLAKASLLISPNPVRNQFTLNFLPKYSGAYGFYLISLTGEKTEIGSQYIEAGTEYNITQIVNLDTGIYFLVAESEQTVEYLKVMIVK